MIPGGAQRAPERAQDTLPILHHPLGSLCHSHHTAPHPCSFSQAYGHFSNLHRGKQAQQMGKQKRVREACRSRGHLNPASLSPRDVGLPPLEQNFRTLGIKGPLPVIKNVLRYVHSKHRISIREFLSSDNPRYSTSLLLWKY